MPKVGGGETGLAEMKEAAESSSSSGPSASFAPSPFGTSPSSASHPHLRSGSPAASPNPLSQSDPMFGFGAHDIRPDELFYHKAPIGKGCYGNVYQGVCRGKEVAIKRLFRQELSEKALSDFRKEVEICSRIRHPNVVLFMGACTEPGHLAIVTELLPAANLESMLHDKKREMSLCRRMRFAKDAAMGMNWLHCSEPPILHRDMKPSNLLVTRDGRVKVCDFGLSMVKPVGEKIKDEKLIPGTPLWMAPEVMSGKPLDEKSDVYSFALTLWEIATQQRLLPEVKNFSQLKRAICQANTRPPTDNLLPTLRKLLEACWHKDPTMRPPFSQIIKVLDLIIIESAIDDEDGRCLWKKAFGGSEYVPWSKFCPSFYKYLGFPPTTEADKEYQCLMMLLCKKSPDTTLKERPPVVFCENFGQVLRWFGPMKRGSGQLSFGNEIENVLRQKWFHGDISKDKAEASLAGREPGTFLIRCSSTVPGQPFTVSKINRQGKIMHQRIHRLPGGPFSLKLIKNQTMQTIEKTGDLVVFISHIKGIINLSNECEGSKYTKLFTESSGKGYYNYSFADDEE